jgi:hypothetical protein
MTPQPSTIAKEIARVSLCPAGDVADEMKRRIRKMRREGMTVPDIMKEVELSRASVYRALGF